MGFDVTPARAIYNLALASCNDKTHYKVLKRLVFLPDVLPSRYFFNDHHSSLFQVPVPHLLHLS